MITQPKKRSTMRREVLALLHSSMNHDMTYKELESQVETSANFDVIMSRMDGSVIKIYEHNEETYVTITLLGLAEHHSMKVKMPV